MKFGLFYQLPCAPDQSVVDRYRETIEQITLADELGFDTAWLAELHFFHPFSIMPAPLQVAVAAAQRTRRIRFGTGVVLLPLHHPLRVAEEAAVADILTGGRLELGVGRGTIAVHFRGYKVPREESRERFEESLAIIRKAWTSERISYAGALLPNPGNCACTKAAAEASSTDPAGRQQSRYGRIRRPQRLRRDGCVADQPPSGFL